MESTNNHYHCCSLRGSSLPHLSLSLSSFAWFLNMGPSVVLNTQFISKRMYRRVYLQIHTNTNTNTHIHLQLHIKCLFTAIGLFGQSWKLKDVHKYKVPRNRSYVLCVICVNMWAHFSLCVCAHKSIQVLMYSQEVRSNVFGFLLQNDCVLWNASRTLEKREGKDFTSLPLSDNFEEKSLWEKITFVDCGFWSP